MRWQSVNDALAAVLAILESPQAGLHDRLSSALADVVPHRALAVLAGDCARSPMSVAGEPAIAARITSADLARLAGTVSVGVPWQGVAPVAGESRPVVAVAAAATAAPSLLVLVRRDEAAPDAQALLLVQRVWDLVGARLRHHIERADPAALAASRAAVAERTRVATGMTDAHEATLAALLGSLRAPDLSDAAARRVATDLAASALVDLRSSAGSEIACTQEVAAEAFARLEEELRPLTRYSSARLELAGPASEQPLPGTIAQAARAIVRGAVLTMLEQEDVGRVRVAWELGDDALVVTVRDDGPGRIAPEALAVHAIAERARVLDGTAELESTPGWGTRLEARLPLTTAVEPPAADPLAALNPRELDVLGQLARGRRNRQVAETLTISENTVKFHVANVLSKLGVSSRGEAAAIARDAGLGEAPLSAVS